MMDLELELGFCREDVGAITVADVAATVRPPPATWTVIKHDGPNHLGL